MKDKKKPAKLTYSGPARFDADKSSPEERRKADDYHFSMTCFCGETFAVPLDILGNAAICPRCNQHIKITEEDFMPVTCGCGKGMRIPRTMAGASKKCPSCKKPIKLLETAPSRMQHQKETSTVEVKPKQALATKATVSPPEEIPTRMKTVCINVNCKCGKKIVLPLSLSQQPIKCPQCQNVFRLPEKSFIQMNCSCGMDFKVLRILEGNYGKCPGCGKTLKITGK